MRSVGSLRSSVVAQIAQDLLLFSRVLSSEARQCVGDDVTVMQILHGSGRDAC